MLPRFAFILAFAFGWVAFGAGAGQSEGRLEKCTFESSLDGVTIEYGLWYPADYDESKPWPLIVFLHGTDDDRSWMAATKPEVSIPVRTSRPDLPFLIAFPLMRGSWSINGPAELDVLETIADVERRAKVDPDQVHLTGLSLGGFGGWTLSSHYPDRFASLSVFAGGGQPDLVGNLRNIPVRVVHGTADKHVPVGEARRMVEAAKAAGVDVEYVEIPHTKHICWRNYYARKSFYGWMLTKRRESSPQRISYSTHSLRHNKAYWAEIGSMIDSSEPASIDVFVPKEGQVLIHAENVGRLIINPPGKLVGAKKKPSFFVDGKRIEGKRINGKWVLDLAPQVEGDLQKRHGLSGPIQDALCEPFVVVTPNVEDAQVNEFWRKAAETSFGWTKLMTFEKFRFITDTELTPEIIASCNLVCFGNPMSHRVLATVAGKLPLAFSPSGLLVHGRPAKEKIAAFVMVYPNPLNPKRYLVVCSGIPQAVPRLAARALQPPQLAATPMEDVLLLTADGRFFTSRGVESESKDRWMAAPPRRDGFVFGSDWQLGDDVVELLAGSAVESSVPDDVGSNSTK